MEELQILTSQQQEYYRLYEQLNCRYTLTEVEPLLPYHYFLAWHGVITVVFQRFPKELLNIKQTVSKLIPDLAPERAGSKWPKVTLAARQTSAGLGKEEALILHAILNKASARLRVVRPIKISNISIVQYRSQSLETRESQWDIPLQCTTRSQSLSQFIQPEVTQLLSSRLTGLSSEELDKVSSVGRDISEYRQEHMGWTMICDLPHFMVDELNQLRNEVGSLLPNRYAWLQPTSHHLTLRGLDRLT